VSVRQSALVAVTHRALVPLWRSLADDVVVIFTLHRFAGAGLNGAGDTVQRLRENLAYLRKRRFHIASLHDLINGAGSVAPRRRGPSVVFTVDDGYAEFAGHAAPVFAEFDCPVTVFLVTDALDKGTWYWWDRVQYCLGVTKLREVTLELGGQARTWRWHTPAERRACVLLMLEALKRIPESDKLRALRDLATRLEVDVPERATAEFAPMSWNDVRTCAQRGFTFGPHTMTHPMLTRVSDDQARGEILQSWDRVRAECGDAAVPVFCYPNGAYTAREVGILRNSGLAAAVTTTHHYASNRPVSEWSGDERFQTPRFGYREERERFVQVVSGLERLKMAVRHGRRGWLPVGAPNRPAPLP
jgi:peptidoglycan/xylan/chitin deacetylase (PgdA/CDA1 family)